MAFSQYLTSLTGKETGKKPIRFQTCLRQLCQGGVHLQVALTVRSCHVRSTFLHCRCVISHTSLVASLTVICAHLEQHTQCQAEDVPRHIVPRMQPWPHTLSPPPCCVLDLLNNPQCVLTTSSPCVAILPWDHEAHDALLWLQGLQP